MQMYMQVPAQTPVSGETYGGDAFVGECPYHTGVSIHDCACGADMDGDELVAIDECSRYGVGNDAPKRQKIPRGRKDWR